MAAMLAAALVLAACGGGDDADVAVSQVETNAPDTEAPPTTEVEVTTTTAAEPTTTVEPPPTTVAEVVEDPGFGDEWTPRCQNVIPAPGSVPGGPIQDALEEFRPLEDRPSLLVNVPTAPFAPGNGEGQDPAYVRVGAVDGGLLFGFGGSGMSNAQTSMVAMVDHAGRRRWVRCLDGPLTDLISAPAGFGPEMVLTAVMPWVAGIEPTRQWTWLSVEDGTVLGSMEDFSATDIDFGTWSVIGTSGITALIGSDLYNELYPSRIATVDLKSGVVTELPSFPQEVIEGVAYPSYGITSNGEIAAFGVGADDDRVAAVWVDGAWSEDAAVRSAAEPIRLMWLGDDVLTLKGIDADGVAVWTNDELMGPGYEGSWISQTDEVAVLQTCTDPVVDEPCGHSLVAVDPSTGAELWRLSGFRETPLGVVDGLLLTNTGEVNSPDETGRSWMLIDALTGQEIRNQRWDRFEAFYQGCCGEGEYFHVHQFGGVVVTVANDRIRVWYPADLDVPDTEVIVP